MSANFTPNQKEYKNLTPFKLCVIENFPFIEADFDAITNYQLFCKIADYLNQVISNNQAVTENTQKLYNAFVSLQDYVNNYFNNLDVQEEINNKLDKMVQTGELQEIINLYLNSIALFCFDTVESMKNSENLINGSYAKTNGYYKLNDGGNGTYKIRNRTFNDIIDNGLLILMKNENLVAELIIENNTVNVNQFGCKINDNQFDNGEILNRLLNLANNKHFNVLFLNGKYHISTPIIINEKLDSITIKGQGQYLVDGEDEGTCLEYVGEGYCITLNNGGQYYKIEDLYIKCNELNNGLFCNGHVGTNNIINFKCYINNVTVTSAVIGMRIICSTYMFINNYTFGGCINTQYGLWLHGYEFTYINNTSIDGYSQPNENSAGLYITNGINTYINNIDICNFKKGKSIFIEAIERDIFMVKFSNTNIIRCSGGIYFNPINKFIQQIIFDKLDYYITGEYENEKAVYFAKPSDNFISQNISFKNVNLRRISNAYEPNYFVDSEMANSFSNIDVEILSCYGLNIKTGINANTPYGSIIYRNNYYRRSRQIDFNPIEETRTYTLKIKYPSISNKRNIIINIINTSIPYKIGDINYNSESNEYEVPITFDSVPTNAFRVRYEISSDGIL